MSAVSNLADLVEGAIYGVGAALVGVPLGLALAALVAWMIEA